MKNIYFYFILVLILALNLDLFSQPRNEYSSDANTVLLLHLNETSGDTVFDASPYHNNGVLYGNLPSEGKFYGGMQFPTNNTDIGIQLNDSPSLNLTGPLTIEAFVKANGYEQGGTFLIRHDEYQLVLGSFGAAGCLQFFKRFGNEWHGVACEERIPLDEWVHLAGVWDGDSMRIFINGRQPLQVTYPPASYVPIGQPILASYYGSILQPTTTTFIDEIRISNVARNFNEGLIAYYPLDGDADDYSGNNNNGTIMGGVTSSTDRFGNANSAMQFNGIDGYIEVPNSPSLQSPTNEITIASWLYVESFPGLQALGIVEKTNSNLQGGQYALSYQTWGNDGLYFNHSNGSQGSYAPITLDFSRWYFVAITYDGTTVITYLDGIPIASQNVPGPIVPDDNPLTLGLESPGQTEYLHGKLDEVRIYNRALSQQEILSLNMGLTNIGDNFIYESVKDFKLVQNYPNPFNPNTKIRYSLPHYSNVLIKVFDILGREVATLINQDQPAGDYSIDFNASNLPSGIYLYKLQAGNYIDTKKMILIK